MQLPFPSSVSSVLIVHAETFYAQALLGLVRDALPAATIRIAIGLECAAAMLAENPARVMVVDLGASFDGDPFDLIARCLATELCVPRVMVMTSQRERHPLTALRSLPVHGVFDTLNESTAKFKDALQIVADDGFYWSQGVLDILRQDLHDPNALERQLTITEQRTLSIIGDGCDDDEAAHELSVSPATIATVRRSLHRKLGVQHRGELVRVAAQLGFVRFSSGRVVRPGFALLIPGSRERAPRIDRKVA